MHNILQAVNAGDKYMFTFVNHRLNCRILDQLMALCTMLGSAAFTVLISVALMILGENGLRLAAMKGFTALIVSFSIGFFLKRRLGRSRPYLIMPDAFVGRKLWNDYSFPSGHTTAGFSLAVSYGMYYPAWLATLAFLACLVGLSRIYMGQHYPTDVVAGAILGISTALLITLILK